MVLIKEKSVRFNPLWKASLSPTGPQAKSRFSSCRKGRAADPPAGDTRARLSVNQPSQSLSALHSGSFFLFSPLTPRAIALLAPGKFNGIDSLQEKWPLFSLSLSFSFFWQRKWISWFNLSYCRPSLSWKRSAFFESIGHINEFQMSLCVLCS